MISCLLSLLCSLWGVFFGRIGPVLCALFTSSNEMDANLIFGWVALPIQHSKRIQIAANKLVEASNYCMSLIVEVS